MQKTAQIQLTSLEPKPINGAIVQIVKTSPKFNVEIIGSPKIINVKWSKKRARVAGCEGIKLQRKVITVAGTNDDLKKILRIKLPEDVYDQLKL